MTAWALVFAGIMNGMPIAKIADGFDTEAECRAALVEVRKDMMQKVNASVVALGVGCIEVKSVPGKPV